MIAIGPRPSADLPAVVWEQYLKAGKNRVQVLQGCAAWIAAPRPVQAIAGAS